MLSLLYSCLILFTSGELCVSMVNKDLSDYWSANVYLSSFSLLVNASLGRRLNSMCISLVRALVRALVRIQVHGEVQ